MKQVAVVEFKTPKGRLLRYVMDAEDGFDVNAFLEKHLSKEILSRVTVKIEAMHLSAFQLVDVLKLAEKSH